MTVTNGQTQACLDAWINCENLLAEVSSTSNNLSKKIIKVIDECAYICMGTFHALKTSSQNINRFALLCIGICEECAELCENLGKEEFAKCAEMCRSCSKSLTTIAYSTPD